jgi:DNA-binding GntR family transcriptional regulator
LSVSTLTTSFSTHVRRESLTDQTARAIREAVLDGTYALGQKLREVELVSRFGVSSSVIREALHVLQGEGIIVTRPYCGRPVFNVDPQQLDELTMIRASLECYAAYLAATKMTPAMGETILSAAKRFTSDLPGGYSDWVDRELGFHRAVWHASQNEWLVRQLNQFSVPIFALRMLGTNKKSDWDVRSLWEQSQVRETDDNPQGHQALALAIVSGGPMEARRMMLLHIFPDPGQLHRDLFSLDRS